MAWIVDDLAELLRRADMAAILEDFGHRTRREDPVVHFYETFLAAYDPKMREARGVYYTPEPVVSYIVRSVDAVLKEKFGRPMGLADPTTLILDPATGTATFLYYVIRHVYETLLEQGQGGAWSAYVRENLLPRIFGFELLMAPYTVAHMKLGILLQELGYDFGGDDRLRVYLTNTLEEGFHPEETIGFAEYIAEEADAAATVKKDEPIEVIIGNPPYSGISANTGEWITNLIDTYKWVDGEPLGERKHWRTLPLKRRGRCDVPGTTDLARFLLHCRVRGLGDRRDRLLRHRRVHRLHILAVAHRSGDFRHCPGSHTIFDSYVGGGDDNERDA